MIGSDLSNLRRNTWMWYQTNNGRWHSFHTEVSEPSLSINVSLDAILIYVLFTSCSLHAFKKNSPRNDNIFLTDQWVRRSEYFYWNTEEEEG